MSQRGPGCFGSSEYQPSTQRPKRKTKGIDQKKQTTDEVKAGTVIRIGLARNKENGEVDIQYFPLDADSDWEPFSK
jgi:hypothetical protein